MTDHRHFSIRLRDGAQLELPVPPSELTRTERFNFLATVAAIIGLRDIADSLRYSAWLEDTTQAVKAHEDA